MNCMRRLKHITLEDGPLQIGRCPICYWRRAETSSRKKNEDTDPKGKQLPLVGVSGDESKVWCCREQYCIGTWNVRSMNQGKLHVVKWEMARLNITILEVSELKLTVMGEFKSDVALIVNKRIWNAVLGCNLKTYRMSSVHFLCKAFNISVIQVFAPTTNAKEAEVKWFYEDLQDLERTPKKDVLFIIGNLNAKVGSQENTWSNRQVWPWSTKWSRAKANRVFVKRTH